MGRARRARRIAQTAAYGGGVGAAGLGALGALGYALLKAEALHARWAIGTQFPESPRDEGWYAAVGADRRRSPIELVVLGDSSAAGLGVRSRGETIGAPLARPRRAGRAGPGPGARPEARRHQHRRQRRDPPDRQGHRGAASRRRGRRAARSRRRGDRRDLPGPRHRPAGGAAAAPGRPAPGARPAPGSARAYPGRAGAGSAISARPAATRTAISGDTFKSSRRRSSSSFGAR